MIDSLDISGMIARSTASGWVLCLIGLFGIWRLYVLGRPKMFELEIAKNSGLREEFIEEMAALRAEVKGLREENEHLRREIRELHGVIDGMRRENLTAHLAGQRVVAESLSRSPAIDRAIDSLKSVTGGQG